LAVELEVGGARVTFTDRHGGVSDPPYDTANLGTDTGDEPGAVSENRRRVGAMLGGSAADPEAWAWVRQVHGAGVARVRSVSDSGAPSDALVTDRTDVPLMILIADCAPVALVAGPVVAAVHVGWRGLAAGVIEASVQEVRSLGSNSIRAVVGPCISPKHYEFSPVDLDRVANRVGPAVRARTGGGEPALDLRAGVHAALARAGVGASTDVDICTYASPDHFSHRRDGVTGRQALIVSRES
jgi:YfiH family protein